jgi:hypothetical protein
MAIKLPDKFENVVQNASQEWLDTRGKTREQLRKFIEARVVRDQTKSPKVGQPAPDFTLERLDERGNRTGEMATLSDYFGKPLGLVFGSYT